MWWLLPAAGAAIKGIGGAIGGETRRKGIRDALSNLANYTPSEREYVKRQREIAEGGDPLQNQMMQEQMGRVVGNIRQTGAESMQRTEGSIIRQGMESSIVAAELRRKTTDTTLRNIAEQSRRITAENRFAQERTKRDAEERALQMEMGVERRGQQAMMQKAQLGGYDRWGTLANIAGTAIGQGFASHQDYYAKKDWDGEG